MINLNSQYPTKTKAPDANYTYGSARNITTPGDGTGTPWEQAIVNDIEGFKQAMVDEAGIVPSGNPETAIASDLLDAIKAINPVNRYALFADEKTSGVNGQTGGISFDKRNLVEIENSITGVSIAADVITLPAGTWRVKGWGLLGCTGDNITHFTQAGVFEGDSGLVGDLLVSGSSARLRADVLQESNIISNVEGQFVLASPSTITFRQYSNRADRTMGYAVGIAGFGEKFAALEIMKIA